ncbi:MAG: cytochrome P450 [Pseudomonadota bacterium]
MPPSLRTAEQGHITTTPGPESLVLFDIPVDPLAFMSDLVERYGDVVRYQSRMGPCLLFVHPDHVRAILHDQNFRRASLIRMMLGDGLLASDGPRWRSQRHVMKRDFLPLKIDPMVCAMTRETARMVACWRDAADGRQSLDVTREMTRLTLHIVVRTLFSEDLSADRANELCEAVTQTILDLSDISWTIFGMPMQFTPTSSAGFAAARKVVDATCYEMIARRRTQTAGQRPRDLLTLLIEAETPSGPMDDVQLRDEMVTMLVGGHETTALALAWAWKLLADHPEAEARLHREVDEVLGEREPTLEDVPRLIWSKAVFQEAMRLYPPVWYMARVATDAGVVGGHAIPPGACVLLSAWLTHRHPEFWSDPRRFDPARFLDDAPTHRYSYFPFGGGRHQCIGMYFGTLEGTLILAQIARQFRVVPNPGQEIGANPGITLRQSPPMQATVERRSTPIGRALP